jgi:hypothetical protein
MHAPPVCKPMEYVEGLHWVVDTKHASSIHRAPVAFSNLIITNLQAPGPGQCNSWWLCLKVNCWHTSPDLHLAEENTRR